MQSQSFGNARKIVSLKIRVFNLNAMIYGNTKTSNAMNKKLPGREKTIQLKSNKHRKIILRKSDN